MRISGIRNNSILGNKHTKTQSPSKQRNNTCCSSNTFKSLSPSKVSKLAYSSLFSLSLISGVLINTAILQNNNSTKKTQTEYQTKAQAPNLYIDMWGRQWAPYSEYTYLKNEADEAKEKANELKEQYQTVKQVLNEVESKESKIDDIYEPLKKNLETETERIEYFNQRIEYFSQKLIEEGEYIGGNFLGALIVSFLITHGIAAIVSIEKKKNKQNPDANNQNNTAAMLDKNRTKKLY